MATDPPKKKKTNPVTVKYARLTAIPDEAALAVVGYTPVAKSAWGDPNGSTACVVGPARRLAALVEAAAARLGLTPEQWEQLAADTAGAHQLDSAADADGFAEALRVSLTGWPAGKDIPVALSGLDGAVDPLAAEVVLSALRFRKHHLAELKPGGEWWRPEFRRQFVAKKNGDK